MALYDVRFGSLADGLAQSSQGINGLPPGSMSGLIVRQSHASHDQHSSAQGNDGPTLGLCTCAERVIGIDRHRVLDPFEQRQVVM